MGARRGMRVAALVLGCVLTAAVAQAEQAAYPSRPLRLILPFPPGGSTDLLGRAIAERLGESLRQPVVPENRPGAGGNVGAEAAARSTPDGYTLVLCAPSLAISPSLYRKLNYDPLRDLVPVALVATIRTCSSCTPPCRCERSRSSRSTRAPIRQAQLRHRRAGHVEPARRRHVRSLTKTEIVLVPYKGAETAMLAVLSGQVQMVVIGTPASTTHVKSGKLRALALLGKERYPDLPDVPTAAESGMPEFEVDTWYGVLAPAGVPREIVARLNGDPCG